MVDRGYEERRRRGPTETLHLRQMLVSLIEIVKTERDAGIARPGRRRCGPVALRHLPSAARVTRDRVHRERSRRRQHTRFDERTHREDETLRVAAGVRHPCRAADRFALPLAKLGQPVGPGRIDTPRAAGVDDARLTVAGEADRLRRRIVRQAQDRQVRPREVLGPGARLATLRLRNEEKLDVVSRIEHLANPEPGRSGLAVDIDLGFVHAGRKRLRRESGTTNDTATCPVRRAPLCKQADSAEFWLGGIGIVIIASP